MTTSLPRADVISAVDGLVRSAQEHGTFFFTQTVLRVRGIEGRDVFEAFRRNLADLRSLTEPAAMSSRYCEWVNKEDFLQFLWNLLKCSQAQPYHAYPFSHLDPAMSWNARVFISRAKIDATTDLAATTGHSIIADIVRAAYPTILVEACAAHAAAKATDLTLPADLLPPAFSTALDLWEALLLASDRERHAFGASNRLVRWPRYEVLELLANSEIGLFGYRVYFSNGSHAEFSRSGEGTEAMNLQFERDGSINYFVGLRDYLRPEWRVGDKALFEVGLPGRYNKLGEWKPLIYEGDSDHLTQEVHKLTDDFELHGPMLYIVATAHWIVEFAVRTNVDLPIENVVSFGATDHPLRLWKCPPRHGTMDTEKGTIRHDDAIVYDGWITLAAPTIDEVQRALIHISIGMSRMAFVYDAELTWCLKYAQTRTAVGIGQPSKEDLKRFDEVLVNPVPPVLDLAMSWYNEGRNSTNPFTGYLCYFNAIESIVEAVWDGDDNLGVQVAKHSKSERLAWRRDCIQRAYDALFEKDPTAFAQEAYFNCLYSLSRRRREVATAVWGDGHWVIAALFESADDKPSLTDIRNWVAHGQLSLLDADDVRLVRARLFEVSRVAKGLILRILLHKSPEDSVEVWSGQHTVGFPMTDPRNTSVANTLSFFPATDWTMRPEWVD